MVINSSTHSPDNRVQGLPSIDVQILPQEVSQAYPLGREASILAGKLQQPVPFSRSSTVAGKLQKVESRKMFSPLIHPHRRHVTLNKELRFVLVKFEDKSAQLFRQCSVKTCCLIQVLEGEYHIVCIPRHVCLPPEYAYG